jgi:PBP1b-binding outer membrane lipoprotein LpoB
MSLHQLSDAELDSVTGGTGFLALSVKYKSFNFQQNNAVQGASNTQAALVNVPILSDQVNQQGVSQTNSIS